MDGWLKFKSVRLIVIGFPIPFKGRWQRPYTPASLPLSSSFVLPAFLLSPREGGRERAFSLDLLRLPPPLPNLPPPTPTPEFHSSRRV